MADSEPAETRRTDETGSSVSGTTPSVAFLVNAADSRTPVDDGAAAAEAHRKELKDMTISDILDIVRTHKLDLQENVKAPGADAGVEEKLAYALEELKQTKQAIAASKRRYADALTSLEHATRELHSNNQLLRQNKLEIQESKLESQRTRLELNALKQQTLDEVRGLNAKVEALFQASTENFNALHESITSTLTGNLRAQQAQAAASADQQPAGTVHQNGSAKRPHISGTPDTWSPPAKVQENGELKEFQYKLAKPLTNVRQIWEEYEYGLYGQPSVKSLDAKYKNRWRIPSENTTYLRRRKIFIAIENCVKAGISETEAINTLERLRIDETGTKRTMAWLFDNVPDNFPEGFFGIPVGQFRTDDAGAGSDYPDQGSDLDQTPAHGANDAAGAAAPEPETRFAPASAAQPQQPQAPQAPQHVPQPLAVPQPPQPQHMPAAAAAAPAPDTRPQTAATNSIDVVVP